MKLGYPIAELQARMSYPEFQRWMAFYTEYPFDDFHLVHRPAALIARSMSGGQIDEILDWLRPEPVKEGFSAADMSVIRAFKKR